MSMRQWIFNGVSTLMVLGACCSPAWSQSQPPSQTPASQEQGFEPYIQISPLVQNIQAGETVAFHARINYDPNGPTFINQPIVFETYERGMGRIESHSGLYVAPDTPGVYHVIARREDHPDVCAVAIVRVTSKSH